MIEIDVFRRLGEFEIEVEIAVEASGITALFGQSGAGKTALVDMIAGLSRPERGRIAIDGEVLFDAGQRIDVPPERRRIGYVFQEDRLFPHMSVRANLEYGLRRAPASQRQIGLDQVVEVLDVRPLLERRPRTLSGGEKQRISIGRALLANPRLLLMDEPLASLDAARKNEILPFIERLSDEFAVPIVYVSHAAEEIVRLADTLVLLSGGRVAAIGAVEELMSRLDLRPLTGRYEAGSVIAARVSGKDATFGLSHLAFPGGVLRVPLGGLPLGREVRIRVRARDVTLSSARPEGLSTLNVFEGTVMEIGGDAEPATLVDVRIDIGVPLWARITRRALHDLQIAPGRRIFTLIKAVAIDHGSLGLRGQTRRADRNGG
jgi:molybdate transport system ATP-binding protein